MEQYGRNIVVCRALLVAFALLSFVAADSSRAAVLTLTGGSLSISLATAVGQGAFGVIGQSPDPTSIFVSSAAGSFVEPASLFSIPPSSLIANTQLFAGVPLISTLGMSFVNATGNFSAGGGPGGGFGGAGLLVGNLHLGFLGGTLNLVVPLPAGQTGANQGNVLSLVVTATGMGWTTGVAQVTGLTVGTPSGGFVNTVAVTGSDARTAAHVGSLTLVTPVRVISNATNFAVLFSQTLMFVPEPGAVLLLGTALGLVALGRKRR